MASWRRSCHDFDELLFVIQPVVIAGAALGKGNGRINAPFGKFPVQADFQIARTLEFLEDHFIHPGFRVHQAGGDDGQAAAFLHIARGGKKLAGLFQGIGAEAAGHDAAARLIGIVAACPGGSGSPAG